MVFPLATNFELTPFFVDPTAPPKARKKGKFNYSDRKTSNHIFTVNKAMPPPRVTQSISAQHSRQLNPPNTNELDPLTELDDPPPPPVVSTKKKHSVGCHGHGNFQDDFL